MRSENSKLQITTKHEKWVFVARSVPQMGVEGCIRAKRWHSSNSECGSPSNSECGMKKGDRLKPGLQRGCGGKRKTSVTSVPCRKTRRFSTWAGLDDPCLGK